jgi:hypothetical protein
MAKTIEVPQNLGDTIKMLTEYRRLVGHARAEIHPAAAYATEHVSHAYDYASDAGAEGDIATTAQALPIRKDLVEIAGHLDAIYSLLGEAQNKVKKSVQAMEEADKRRSEARRKLTL